MFHLQVALIQFGVKHSRPASWTFQITNHCGGRSWCKLYHAGIRLRGHYWNASSKRTNRHFAFSSALPSILVHPPPSRWRPDILLLFSLRLHSQCNLEVLVHHVADAHRRNDLHEVGGQASVKSQRPLSPNDVPEQPCHAHLRTSLQRSWGDKRSAGEHLQQTPDEDPCYCRLLCEGGTTWISPGANP